MNNSQRKQLDTIVDFLRSNITQLEELLSDLESEEDSDEDELNDLGEAITTLGEVIRSLE